MDICESLEQIRDRSSVRSNVFISRVNRKTYWDKYHYTWKDFFKDKTKRCRWYIKKRMECTVKVYTDCLLYWKHFHKRKEPTELSTLENLIQRSDMPGIRIVFDFMIMFWKGYIKLLSYLVHTVHMNNANNKLLAPKLSKFMEIQYNLVHRSSSILWFTYHSPFYNT